MQVKFIRVLIPDSKKPSKLKTIDISVMTPEDIKRAMMMEMFLFNNRPNLLEKAQEIRQMLFGEQEESDSEDEELESMEDEDEFSENDCTCPVCRVMNNIYIRWEGWTPNTLFEKTIKKHIDKM